MEERGLGFRSSFESRGNGYRRIWIISNRKENCTNSLLPFVCRERTVYGWLDKAFHHGKLTIPDSVGQTGGEPRDTDSAGISCGRDK